MQPAELIPSPALRLQRALTHPSHLYSLSLSPVPPNGISSWVFHRYRSSIIIRFFRSMEVETIIAGGETFFGFFFFFFFFYERFSERLRSLLRRCFKRL